MVLHNEEGWQTRSAAQEGFSVLQTADNLIFIFQQIGIARHSGFATLAERKMGSAWKNGLGLKKVSVLVVSATWSGVEGPAC